MVDFTPFTDQQRWFRLHRRALAAGWTIAYRTLPAGATWTASPLEDAAAAVEVTTSGEVERLIEAPLERLWREAA